MVRLAGWLVIGIAFLLWLQEQAMPAGQPRRHDEASVADEIQPTSLAVLDIQLPAPPPVPARTSAPSAGKRKPSNYAIAFAWPRASQARLRLREVLHHCLGVRLAKVNEAGQVLVIEDDDSTSLAHMSPYVRLYQERATATDEALLRGWQGIDGKVVRFYPKRIDRQLFAEIDRLTTGLSSSSVRIEAAIALAGDTLVLHSLTINGQAVDTRLVLARFNKSC